MSETPPEFDLKFLPDWLKEGAPAPKYANYEGDTGDRRGSRDDRGPRRDGPGGFGGRGRPGARPGGGGERRGPGGPGGPGGPRREGGGPRGDRRSGPGGGDRRDDRRREEPREPRPAPAPPVEVKIEFLPEPNGAEGIARQIKSSSRAYPLFGAGRLFLERPERHRVRISSIDPTVPLYQIDDGPIASSQAALEKTAFQMLKGQYYAEEVVQGEPIKGNFANVARSRASGIYLGPTNYHSYQPGLRRLYEERFSRRMSFQDFLYQDVEILTTEQAINDWKEQARSSTTWTTTQEPEPVVFKTLAETEQHFRAHYLRNVVKAGLSLECSGVASRTLPDRSIAHALRDSWERERGFPVQTVNNLRPYLVNAGLHFFKHRKRILYVSAIRPMRHAAGQALSSGVSAILHAIEEGSKLTRRDLAIKVLGADFEATEKTEAKEALARDLHYLIHAGQVIEFHDGTLDLPLAPNANPPRPPGGGKKAAPAKEDELSPEDLAEAAAAEGLTPPPEPSETPAAPETVGALAHDDGEIHSQVHESEAQSSTAGEAPATTFSSDVAPPEPAEGFAAPPEPPGEAGLDPEGALHGEESHPPAETAGALHGAGEHPLPGAQSLREEGATHAPIPPVISHEDH